jgi:cell division protein ZapB
MEVDLSPLEQKIEKVVAFCQGLREENRSLRVRVDELESERDALTDKIATARQRLEDLMERMPTE